MRMETTSAAGLVFEAKSGSNAIVGKVPTLVPVDVTKYKLETLREDGELVLHRGRSRESRSPILVLLSRNPSPDGLRRLESEYSLRDELDPSWAVQIGRAHV